MLKDCKYIRKENEQEWLREIKKIVLNFCEDKAKRGVVGWNNIVEHEVWRELKSAFNLTTFPRNLYDLVRSTFDECLKATEKTPALKAEVKSNLDFMIDLKTKKLANCVDVAELIKLGAKKHEQKAWLAMSSKSLAIIMRSAEGKVCLWQGTRTIKEHEGHEYVANKFGEVNLIFKADEWTLKLGEFQMTFYSVDDLVVMSRMNVTYPYHTLLNDMYRYNWCMFDDCSLKRSLQVCFDETCDEIKNHISKLTKISKDCEKYVKLID